MMRRRWKVVVVVASVLSIGACSPGDRESAPNTAPSPDAVNPAIGSTTDAQELDTLWEMYVERQFPDEPRPDVPLIRYATPRELAALKVECLNAAGFPDVVLTDDDAVSYGAVPPEQELAFGLANYTCAAQYLVDPIYRAPLSAEQLGTLYDYYQSGLIPCLAERGYPVEDVPSKETFVANYAAEGWNPYTQVAPLIPPTDWAAMNDACPQWPSGFYGF